MSRVEEVDSDGIRAPLFFHRAKLTLAALCAALLPALLPAQGIPAAKARAVAPARLEIALAGTPMHGIEGITVGPGGALFVASISGQSLYRVDPATGVISTFIGPPFGGADDLTFGSDGTAVWTGGAGMTNLMAREPDGELKALVSGTPGLNAVRFSPSGRLLFTRLFARDGLYEADPLGVRPVRVIVENIGGLNAFDFAPDGAIVGPLFMRGTVVRLDPESGESRVIAAGFSFPSAVRVLADGYLVLNYRSGEIWRLDASAETRRLLARVAPPADNFIVKDGRTLYVTSTAWNGITEVDLTSGSERRVTWSPLTLPGTLSVSGSGRQERLLIADDTTLKRFDPRTGALEVVPIAAPVMGVRAAVATADGFAFASTYSPDRVSLVDEGKPPSVVTGFGRAMSLLATSDGLWIADYQRGEVVRLGAEREVVARQLLGPVGLAVSSNGSIFVSEYQAGRISELRAGHAGASAFTRSTLVEGLSHPEGIAMAKDGRLLVVDTGTRELIAINIGTGRRTVLADRLAVGYRHTDDEIDPVAMAGIVVTEDGDAYVSGSIDNVLYRISLPH